MDEKEREKLLKEIEKYTKKIEKEPNNASYWNSRGITYNKLREYNKAISDYDRAIELNSEEAVYFNNRGNSYSNLEVYDKAIDDFNIAIKLDPKNSSYFGDRGFNYYILYMYKEAIDDFNIAIKLDPNNDFYYDSRGNSYYFLDMYKEAIDDFNIAIKLNPNTALYFYDRGVTYNCLKRYKEAIDDFNVAIKLDPTDNFYYYERGNTFVNLKKYKEAINDFNIAIKLDPTDDFYYYKRGGTFNKLKNYKKAIDDFNEAIKLNPNNASYFNSRGVIYNRLKRYKEAIDDFNIAIKLNPNYTLAYNNKGFTLHILDEFEEAINNFNRAIELDPNYRPAIENRESSLKELENIKKRNQVPAENKGSQIDKTPDPEYQNDFNKAKALHLQGEINENFKKAEKEFSIFLNKYKDSSNKSPALENLLTEATSYLVASKFKVKKFMGYLTFADILGWKGIWQKQNTPNGKVSYTESLFSIKNNLKTKFNNEKNFYNINLISDTFVIFSEDFKQSNELSRNLIQLCLEKGLLIRGATSYGECYNKDMVYIGQAVDEAASWHEKGEEIGIFYTASAKLNIKLSDDIELKKCFLINDEVNTKIGKIKTYFINWYNEITEKNFYEIMKKEIIYPEISSKYFNTENRLKRILHPEEKEKK